MDILKKLDQRSFKQELPEFVTSGRCFHLSLGVVENVHWFIDITLLRSVNPTVPFKLRENLASVHIRMKLHSHGLVGSVFTLGAMEYTTRGIKFSVCTFHQMFGEKRNIEGTKNFLANGLSPSIIEQLRASQDHIYIQGQVSFYFPQDSESATEGASCKIAPPVLTKEIRLEVLSHLGRDLKNIFTDSIYTDFNIRCGSEVLKVHRAILSGRYPVFDAMLRVPMKENLENELIVEDITPQVLRVMLEFLYSGQIENLTNELAFELIPAAEKYLVEDLKKMCFDYLKTGVTLDNMLNALELADMYCKNYKEFLIKLITLHYDSLEASKKWESLKTEKSHLITEIMDMKNRKFDSFGSSSQRPIRNTSLKAVLARFLIRHRLMARYSIPICLLSVLVFYFSKD